MHKHTLGPWKIGDQYGPVMDEIRTAEGQTIAAVWTHRGRSPMRSPAHRREAEPVEQCVANAQLIAAAPDLLEALEKVRQDINWMQNSRQFLNPDVFEYLDLAIAKATGNPSA